MNPSPSKQWSWDAQKHSHVQDVLMDASIDPEWCDRLEKSTDDTVVGMLLCVCAATAIARAVFLAESSIAGPSEARAPLELLENWIDNPTAESFEGLCRFIFEDAEANTGNDLPEAVWWAIRTAASSAGNYEASWALRGTWDAAMRAGASPAQLARVMQNAVLSRRNAGKLSSGSSYTAFRAVC